MSLTAAMTEAYANQSSAENIIETVEFDNPAFDEPLRVVNDFDEDVMFPLEEGGDPVLFRATRLGIVLPGTSSDGETPMKLSMSNISNIILPYLRRAIQGTQGISVTYRGYLNTDLTKPHDVIPDLELRDVNLTPKSATGTLTTREIELEAYPRATYDEQYYPTLQNN